jgi:hypothetical protein
MQVFLRGRRMTDSHTNIIMPARGTGRIASPGCLDMPVDAMRFRGRRGATTIGYRFVVAGASRAAR